MSATRKLTQLYPVSIPELPLDNLYLANHPDRARPFVYTNFITSLDGRIAIEHPVTGKRGVPEFISNARDWRLYQELAARADVLLVSARYIRELARGEAQDSLPVSQAPEFRDLRDWRLRQGLSAQPAVVILSASLDLPLADICDSFERDVYVATGEQTTVTSLEHTRAKILFAGDGNQVAGRKLVKELAALGFRHIYSIAGPVVFETLLRDHVLDRIYLTQVHRMVGGVAYDTLFEGRLLTPPANFKLQSLYYDESYGDDCGQFFSIYDRVRKQAGD